MRSIEKTGKKPEDAINAGLKELGCDLSDVTIDILDAGSPGLFGMFGRLAKVRLTVKEEEQDLDFDFGISDVMDEMKSKPAAPAPRRAEKTAKPAQNKEQRPAETEKPAKPEKPRTEKPKAEKPRAEKPAPMIEAVTETPDESEAQAVPVRETESRRPARAPRAPKERKAPEAAAPAEPFEPTDPATLTGEGLLAYDFLKNMTEKIGVPVQIMVKTYEDHISVSMMGDTLGILIGRRGETLDALQYLTSLIVNKQRSGYMRVSLDTENYRAKREEALGKLAQRMAARARKTGRKVTLEPMNPYERRVLHSALQNNPYVTTHSEGEEPYRRVIITLKDGTNDN